jgi:imidazolonepropionase-like amidohydrolase
MTVTPRERPMPGRERALDRRTMLGLLAAGVAAPRAFAAGAPLSCWLDDAPRSFTLSNATVVLHTGERVTNGGVRVQDGRIIEVGAGLSGGVDLGGAWLVPGFTDAGCTVGLYEIGLEDASHDDNEASDAVTPDARVVDAYNPLSEVVPVTRAGGITTVLVHPAPSRLVTGQAALFHTIGRTVAEATVQAPLGLCVNLGHAGTGSGSGAPRTRMGVAMKLRELLEKVDLPNEDEAEDAKGWWARRKEKGGDSPDADADTDAADDDLTPIERLWLRARRGELPVLFHADRADDLLAAVALCESYGLRGVLVSAAEGWLVAPELAAAGLPVLCGPTSVQPDSFEHPHARYNNAAVLAEHGVQLAFRTGSNHFSRGLRTSVGLACAHGLPWEAGIRGLTSAVGDIFGIGGLGRLEAGAPATFQLFDGDPLQPRFAVRRVWVGGREASLDTRQSRLLQQFEDLW